MYAEAKGYGAGFVGVSQDSSTVIVVTALNKVRLGSGVSLTGYDGVDIEATFQRGRYLRVHVRPGHRPVRLPRVEREQHHDADLQRRRRPAHRRQASPRAQVTAGPRSLGNPNLDEHPTDLTPGAGTLDHLALYVNTTNQITRIDRDSDDSRRALAAGGSGGGDRRTTRAGPSPGTPTSTSSRARARCCEINSDGRDHDGHQRLRPHQRERQPDSRRRSSPRPRSSSTTSRTTTRARPSSTTARTPASTPGPARCRSAAAAAPGRSATASARY